MTITKQFLQTTLLLVLSLSLLVGGCTSDSQPSEDLAEINPRQQAVLFWHPYVDEEAQALSNLVDEFNTTNEWGITVIAEYAGSPDELDEKVQALLSEDERPQIVTTRPHYAASYARQDLLVDLAPYVESSTWGYTQLEQQDFYTSTAAVGRMPQFEARYGWTLSAAAEMLFYNEDWLAELGYVNPPRTWDVFETMACAASAEDPGVFGYRLTPRSATFVDMLANHGGTLADPESQNYTFESQAAEETLSYLQALIQDNCAQIDSTLLGAQDDFAAGEVLFAIHTTSDLPQFGEAIAAGAGFNWSVAPLPTTDRATLYLEGMTQVVIASSAQQELASWLLLKWLAEPGQQARWMVASDELPVRMSTVDESTLAPYLERNPAYAKVLRFLEGGYVTPPPIAGYGACQGPLADMLRRLPSEETAPLISSTLETCQEAADEG